MGLFTTFTQSPGQEEHRIKKPYEGTMTVKAVSLITAGVFTICCVTDVEGAVTVSGSGGTGIPNQQALTLRCSYTVTPGDVVAGYTWKMGDGLSAVNVATGSVTAKTTVFLESWQNKGVFVGDYTSSLDIQLPASHVTSSFAGTYRCEVTGLSGFGQVSVTASVLDPPSISGLPPVQTVTEFSNLRIDCSTYTTPGNPPTTSYTWTYGGSTVSTGAVLDRSSISRIQGGSYTCTASNTQGSDSASVNVDVQYGPGTSVTITTPGPLERVEGSGPFTATCTAVCNPSCTITWRKDNSDETSGQISLSNVSRTDQGDYTCQAQNSIGGPQQKNITLVVYYLASPRLTFNKMEVMENTTVTVDCDVDSNPTVQMTVRNVDNNTVLVQRNTNTLSHTIQRAQCLHNGSYVCSADNRKTGTVHNTTMPLNVLCSPRHDYRKQLNSVVAQNKNTTASLTVDIIANPLPNFTWYRHDGGSVSPISNKTGITVTSTALQSVLQIYITSDADYGDYAVSVQNSVGQNMMVFNLTSQTQEGHTGLNGPNGPDLLAVGGGIGAALLLILIVVVVVVILCKRGVLRSKDKNTQDVGLCERRSADEPEIKENDLYASENLVSPAGAEYAVVKKKEKKKKTKQKGDVYENVMPKGSAGESRTNAGFEGDVTKKDPKCGRDQDGLLYVGIDFDNTPPRQEIHQAEESTAYAAIAIGEVGPHLQPEEDKQQK